MTSSSYCLWYASRVRPLWEVKDNSEGLMLLEQATGIAASIFASYPVCLGLGKHTAAVLAEPGGSGKVLLATKIQMIGYRMYSSPGQDYDRVTR